MAAMFSSHSLGSQPNLFPPRVSGIGWQPLGIAVADVDRDGWLDVVTANARAPFVSVLYGGDSGNLANDIRVPSYSGKSDVVVVDLNHDGINDLVTGSAGGPSVFLGTGNRTFAEEVLYLIGDGGFAVAAADVNGDGHVDVIHGGYYSYIFLGNGDGTLGPQQLIEENGDLFDFVVTGDLNEDGAIDLFAGTTWLGQGDGSFVQAPRSGSISSACDGVLHDFDGDGHLDFAVARDLSGIFVGFGMGDGQFAPAVLYDDFVTTHIALGDVDGDGHQDLIGASANLAEIAVLQANADGTFQPATMYQAAISGGAVKTGDFDRDGTVDVAFVSQWGGPGIFSPNKTGYAPRSSVAMTLFGDGQGGLISTPVESFGTTIDGPEDLVVGDFNEDGHQDLATANSEASNVSIALGAGDGSFVELDPANVGVSPTSLVVGNFDAGTTQDLAVANAGSSDLSILLGNGDGSFSPSTAIALSSPPVWVTQADFDADGIQDLATANPDAGEINILLGLGTGSFEPPEVLQLGGEPVSLAVADLDGSAGLDLAVAHGGEIGYVSILLSNGDGTFEDETRYSTGTEHVRSMAGKDLDGDGYVDLTLVGTGEPVAIALYGNGAGGFSEPVTLSMDASGRNVAIADFDGDGRQDVAVANVVPMISIQLGNDDGFASTLEFASGGGGGLAVGEFNRDGLLDLAVAPSGAQRIVVHLNQAPVFVQFAGDKSTLSWPFLVGYDEFNVYRGDIADLQDSDGDGFPDYGYGDCKNELDPDLTDTVFVDPEVPLPESSFFYLMSRVRDGMETDLGTTSGGQPRIPSVPCITKTRIPSVEEPANSRTRRRWR